VLIWCPALEGYGLPQEGPAALRPFSARWRVQLLERHSGARPRLSDLKPAVALPWATDRRPPALGLQAPMSLHPGRRFLGILNPMDQSGLIAPLVELRHYPAMAA